MKLQVGVKVLIGKDGKYLFLRRSQSFKAGLQQWDIPGGRIAPDEKLQTALEREVEEETGLRLVEVGELLAAQDIFNLDKDLHVIRLTYLGAAAGEVTISDEHDAYRWMTVQELLEEGQVDQYLKPVLESLNE